MKTITYFKSEPANIIIAIQNDLFLAIAEILTEELLEKEPDLNKIYNELKKAYIEAHSELFEFKWLYADDLRKFRDFFIESLTCFSYLHLETKYLYIVNICLSKIIVQDSSEFEAVIEQFIKRYINIHSPQVFENETMTTILLQVLNKFKQEIPFCYDDLFIKAQMKKLAKCMRERNIQHDGIDYWDGSK